MRVEFGGCYTVTLTELETDTGMLEVVVAKTQAV